MKAYSTDLRERVLAAVDAKEGTQQEIADRVRVSEVWIRKMKWQRRELGTLEPQTHRCGRKPSLDESQESNSQNWSLMTPTPRSKNFGSDWE